MTDTSILVSETIQNRLSHLKYNYDKLWLEMMSATTGEAKTAKIHELTPLGNEMSFLSGLLNDVISERKEAKEVLFVSLEIIQESVSIINDVVTIIPKGHIPLTLYEKLYQFLTNYKTAKK